MIDLLITKRASCYVLGGIVMEQEGCVVKLEGEIPLPVSGGRQTIRCNVKIKESVANKIKLIPGSYIVVMVKPDDDLDMIWEGAEFPVEELNVSAFYIKTGGEVKLEAGETDKEKYIFLGEISNSRKLDNGYEIINARLYNGEIKTVVAFNEMNAEIGKKYAFLTGTAKANSKGRLFYPMEKGGLAV